MCLPMTATQKQLVEDYLDLVPRMVNTMTHPHTGTTAEEKEELCQIGYLALCRAASMCRPGSRFKTYAMAAIRHAFYSYWKGISRDRKFLCPLEGNADSKDDFPLLPRFPMIPMPRCILNRLPILRQSPNTLPSLKAASAARSKKG